MNIKELLPAVKEKIQAGKLSLTDLTVKIPQLSFMSGPYPEVMGITLSKTKVTYIAKDDLLSLSGTGNWKDAIAADYNFSLQNSEKGPVAKAEIRLPAEYILVIPGLNWFRLNEVEVSLETTYPGDESETGIGFTHHMN